jgi:hypothetical protein
LKAEALGHTLWKTQSGKGCGPVIRRLHDDDDDNYGGGGGGCGGDVISQKTVS